MPSHFPGATPPEDILRHAFDAFNRRNADDLLALVSDEVTWSSDDGMLKKGGLRDFWSRNWSKVRTFDKVTHIRRISESDYIVSLDQEIRALDGALISTGRFRYRFAVREGRIAALRARDPV